MDIIRKIITNYTLVHAYSNEDYLIKLSVEDLLKLNIVNWKYNRPPDEIRCNEIRDYFIKPSTIINIPFHLYYNEKYNEFECLDGIHRYTGLTLVEDKELINNKVVIIYLYFKKSEGELIDIFKTINKSIVVPELYISGDYSLTDKDNIEFVVNDLKNRYSEHFSSNKDFRVPQINRDKLIEILTEIYNEYKIRNKSKLLELVNKANECVKEYLEGEYEHRKLSKKFTPKQLEKCHKTSCYLFLYKESNLKEYFFPQARDKIKTI